MSIDADRACFDLEGWRGHCGALGSAHRAAPMSNTVVPILNGMAGRLIAGVLDLSMDHPVVLCLVLATVAGAAAAVLLDAVTGRGPARTDERPIRLWRR